MTAPYNIKKVPLPKAARLIFTYKGRLDYHETGILTIIIKRGTLSVIHYKDYNFSRRFNRKQENF